LLISNAYPGFSITKVVIIITSYLCFSAHGDHDGVAFIVLALDFSSIQQPEPRTFVASLASFC
jgi:hypothetical protein